MADRPAHHVFDRQLIDLRRHRWLAAAEGEGSLFLLRAVAEELADRLSLVERHFEIGVDLAGHTGETAKRLRAGRQVGTVLRIERLFELIGDDPLAVIGDEETLPLAAESVDLIVSTLSLQLTNDTPGVLVQLRRALKPDGLFLCAFLGSGSLSELRASFSSAESELYGGASPRVAPFPDVRDAGALLQRSGFALPVADLDHLTVRYDNAFELMADLRAMGMANMLMERSRRPASRRLFQRMAEVYQERFSDSDGRIRASFDVIYMSGWRPHDSQQKPLRPGSAKTSLADVLKDRSKDFD